jgi:hypothetical protein
VKVVALADVIVGGKVRIRVKGCVTVPAELVAVKLME